VISNPTNVAFARINLNSTIKKLNAMKKTIKMIGMACLVGAFAFVGSSCKKNNTDTNSIKLSLPALEEISIDGERAYIDYNDGQKMKWSKGDEIMYYNLNSEPSRSIRQVYTLYEGAGSTVGYFSGLPLGDVQDPDLGYFAFYPASKVVNYELGPRNSQKFDVPAEQHYNYETMDPKSLVMAVKGFSPQESATFAHIFGFARIMLKGTQRVEWVSITDNFFTLSGDMTIDIPAVDPDRLLELVQMSANPAYSWEEYFAALEPYLYTEEDGLHYNAHGTGKTITLICDEPVQLSTDQYTKFFITLRPGCLGKGFVVKVKYEGVDEPQVFNKFNPDHAEWSYGGDNGYWTPSHLEKYPRGFSVQPRTVQGYRLN
jgi:hypothetical protein